jgi:hypothetical protein
MSERHEYWQESLANECDSGSIELAGHHGGQSGLSSCTQPEAHKQDCRVSECGQVFAKHCEGTEKCGLAPTDCVASPGFATVQFSMLGGRCRYH